MSKPELAPDRFEAQAARTPDAMAVAFEGASLSYRALDERANQLAHHLVGMKMGPDKLVGIRCEQSLERIVAVLAVWKAGAAFVPLEPSYPADRLAYMIEDAGLTLVLDGTESIPNMPTSAPPRRLLAEHLAYVIYTSGSTGRPKGVLVSHAGLCNLADAQIDDFRVTPQSRVLQFASFSFDAAVSEILMALLSGATLVLAKRDAMLPGPSLVSLLTAQRITTVTLPPSALGLMAPDALPTVRTLATAGEASSAQIVARWGKGRRLLNAYGPTEITVCATSYACVTPGRPPIGRPIKNTEVFILNSELQRLPDGEAGEIFIGGPGLARGYLGRPDLTAEKFVPHPYAATPGARLYRTGDLARMLPSGDIDFLGRIDQQVKLRGHRIELGEIEHVITEHPGVRDACAVVRQSGDDQQLVVYYVPSSSGPSSDALREHVAAKLPAYMVPQAFVPLAAFPTTPAGKVDRQALPAPSALPTTRSTEVAPPRNAIEQSLVRDWEALLSVAPIGIHDDFFALGGHSFLAVRLVVELERKYGVRLQASQLLGAPTIAELAPLVGEPRPAQNSPLVVLQRKGRARPLFLIHPIGGNAICYLELARKLGPDQPVYGLQAVGLDGATPPLNSIVEMARVYTSEITQVQPKGPYRVGGWSAGGIIAFEVAQQLVHAGEQVEVVALIDARAPNPAVRDHALKEVFHDFEDGLLGFWFVLTLWRCAGREVPAEYDEFAGRTGTELYKKIDEHLQPLDFLNSGGTDKIELLFNVYKANMHSVIYYEPQPYSGSLLLFQAQEDPLRREHAPFPPPWGWERYCSRIERQPMHGNHFTGIYPPNVHRLAQTLKQHLEALSP